jgi:hypothetical protein
MTARIPWLPLLLLGLALPAGSAPKEEKDQAPRIARLIVQMDDDDFQVRQTASAELKKIGPPAEAAWGRMLWTRGSEGQCDPRLCARLGMPEGPSRARSAAA